MTDCNIHVKSYSKKPPVLSRTQQKVFIDVWPEGNHAVPVSKAGETIAKMFESDGGNGVMFCTYNLLRAGVEKQIPQANETTEEFINRVGAALKAPGTRFMQIMQWLQVLQLLVVLCVKHHFGFLGFISLDFACTSTGMLCRRTPA